MVEKWYHEIHNKFPDIVCHEMVVMPNHFHCIWENVGLNGAVGANLCVRPATINNDVSHPYVRHDANDVNTVTDIINNDYCGNEGAHAGAHVNVGNDDYCGNEGAHAGAHVNVGNDDYCRDEGAHAGAPLREVNDSDLIENVSGSPLSAVVGWFKTMSTNEYIRGVKQLGWPPFDRKLWQRNYYEHIIRDDRSLCEIAYYITNNPARWSDDKFYPNKSYPLIK
ncbi:MAG: hypothetical protein IIT63_09855 [Prevotella sp.]|nr:hypothetical protein [Prevotella sp.]